MRRIFHHWEKWECVKAGMYSESDLDRDEALEMYATFFRDIARFTAAMIRVTQEWPISCEQFLTNDSINRIAWLGQASMCMDTGVPRCFRAGFMLLSRDEQAAANQAAEDMLRHWLFEHQERPFQLELWYAPKDLQVGEQMETAGVF